MRKHSVPLAGVGTFALFLAASVAWLYMRPVNVEVKSYPDHAAVYVNGEKQACCTPTTITLGFGRHELSFEPPPGYIDVEPTRDVKVEWGKARGLGPVVFAPNFQTVFFKTEPVGARVELRDARTRAYVDMLTSNDLVARLPPGFYQATISKEGFEPVTEMLDVRGNAEALVIDRSLTLKGTTRPSD